MRPGSIANIQSLHYSRGMESYLLIIGIIVLIGIVSAFSKTNHTSKTKHTQSTYSYSAKQAIMTTAEITFYNRLQTVAGNRYYIFPQIHLTALAKNETQGKYYKLGYQRLNRRSVDYVLCDKGTLKPVYAVELDDITHDSPKRQARDTIVETILKEIGLPLVRFRNTASMSDDDIAQKFYEIRHHT